MVTARQVQILAHCSGVGAYGARAGVGAGYRNTCSQGRRDSTALFGDLLDFL